jgi:hypothetical protein
VKNLGQFHLRNEFQLGWIRGFCGYADVHEAMMSTGEPGVEKKVAAKQFGVILEEGGLSSTCKEKNVNMLSVH